MNHFRGDPTLIQLKFNLFRPPKKSLANRQKTDKSTKTEEHKIYTVTTKNINDPTACKLRGSNTNYDKRTT